MKPIRFRPHHFLCTVGFQGKGYSSEFIENYKSLIEQLDLDPIIEVVEQLDSICTACPNKSGTLCTTQSKIEQLDHAHSKVLDIKAGDRIKWSEAKQKIILNFNKSNFNKACEGCEWKPYGYCEKALEALKKP